MSKLLILDEDTHHRAHLADFFQLRGHQVLTADSASAAMALLRQDKFETILASYHEVESNALTSQIKGMDCDVMLVIMVDAGRIGSALAAMRAGGVYECLDKPFSLVQAEQAVERALETRRLRIEVRGLRDTLEEQPFLEFRSPVMQGLLRDAKCVAASDAAILLTGERGTGKNVLARQIHLWSPRREGAFVVINCATISSKLLESELFGCEEASIGAIKRKPGRIESANKGTIFLDEISDLSAGAQARLLRFSEEQTFERVGGDESIHVDARIIAATNRDLSAEVATNRFRQDLFYRLSVMPLNVPALRERPADILPLAERLLSTAACRNRRGQLRFAPEAQKAIADYKWPGNVRELRNAVERAVILSQGDLVGPESLPDTLLHTGVQRISTSSANLQDIERQQITRILSESATLQEAAAILGISASTLWRKRKRYKLE